MQDIRYKQRFENFEKSFLLLKEAISIKNPSIVEEAGVIQFFEITFELAWKMMKDYLEFQGFNLYGLTDKELNEIKNILKKHTSKAILFGSRAKGNYKKGSDIDLYIIPKDKNRDIEKEALKGIKIGET